MSLSLSDKRQQSTVISRRQLLQAGGIAPLALSRPGSVAASLDRKRGLGGGAAEKSCIFIWMCGGPSHLDTWDLKPAAPAEIRGPYRPIATTVPGMRICELHQPAGPFEPPFQSHPLDDPCRQHQQPFRRHAPLPERPGGRPPTHRTSAPSWRKSGPAGAASLLCLADQMRRRSGLLCARISAPGAILGMSYSPLFVGSATNHPAMPRFRASRRAVPRGTRRANAGAPPVAGRISILPKTPASEIAP